MAQFRGWAPLIALQIEYSLLERTVEGELIPMAQELGLGVTPWSPLKSGALSGKFTRENAGKVKADRGDQVTASLSDNDYAIIDELQKISKELNATVAAVALAWVQRRPGVSSTIIGARTMEQLEANLAALDVQLSAEHLASLDELSKPKLNFPAEFLKRSPSFAHAGATVNGVGSAAFPMIPVRDEERY
jgi:aryl-alcohol dehydrogenase-like predicted oxidoreductase